MTLDEFEKNVPQRPNEFIRRIVCAANKFSDGTIIVGARHYDMLMHNIIRLLPHLRELRCVQGFVDQKGNFLTREEAFDVALEQNQIIQRCGGDYKTLYSENLY